MLFAHWLRDRSLKINFLRRVRIGVSLRVGLMEHITVLGFNQLDLINVELPLIIKVLVLTASSLQFVSV